jgi:hypothetical protein
MMPAEWAGIITLFFAWLQRKRIILPRSESLFLMVVGANRIAISGVSLVCALPQPRLDRQRLPTDRFPAC